MKLVIKAQVLDGEVAGATHVLTIDCELAPMKTAIEHIAQPAWSLVWDAFYAWEKAAVDLADEKANGVTR